jgi:prepilin-type N-terminal cleavage/methylation domain-containing protein
MAKHKDTKAIQDDTLPALYPAHSVCRPEETAHGVCRIRWAQRKPEAGTLRVFVSWWSNFSPLRLRASAVNKSSASRASFTLVELLIVITIIAMLAAIAMGALAKTREAARADKTKATIAKLNDVVMRKYESYMNRRVPIMAYDGSNNQIPIPALTRREAGIVRLTLLRDMIRMEMPENLNDVTQPPLTIQLHTKGGQDVKFCLPRPSLYMLYNQKLAATPPAQDSQGSIQHARAKCLYMMLMMGNADARELFGADEMALTDDTWPVFVDGWGKPIVCLRWVPGFSQYYDHNVPSGAYPPNPVGAVYYRGGSDIQTGDPVTQHDPFDPAGIDDGNFNLSAIQNREDPVTLTVGDAVSGGITRNSMPAMAAFRLLPLIFSSANNAATNAQPLYYGLALSYEDPNSKAPLPFNGDPYQMSQSSPPKGSMVDNPTSSNWWEQKAPALIHNHHMEQR